MYRYLIYLAYNACNITEHQEEDKQLVVYILIPRLLVDFYLSAVIFATLPSLHDMIFISQDDSDLRF